MWYGGLSGRGIKPGLENERELLRRLGNPQDSLRLIHVAGTDGKGSVCAMMESILRASGYRTGMFTTPEILEVNECIRFDGCDIEDEDLDQILGRVRVEAEGMSLEGRHCTSFEVLTAAALLFFSTVSADFAIVEVGMGGRLDSTNVIVPEVTVINNIGLEHTEYLGDTLESVASEKAGIMKSGVPCVTMNPDDVFDILDDRATEVGCPLYRVLADDISVLSLRPDSVEFSYGGIVYKVGIPGRHQARNAVLAMVALSMLGDDVIMDNLHRGLEDAYWPCRMQKLMAYPIIVDVTHTVAGARSLASDVREIYGDVTVVLGMLSDKDVDGVVRELVPVCSRMIATQPDSPRAMPVDRLVDVASAHLEVDSKYPSIHTAMEAAMDGEGMILVTGSFRMAEGVLGWLATKSSRYSTYCPRNIWAERILDAIRRD